MAEISGGWLEYGLAGRYLPRRAAAGNRSIAAFA
jgi:hypothetical protein